LETHFQNGQQLSAAYHKISDGCNFSTEQSSIVPNGANNSATSDSLNDLGNIPINNLRFSLNSCSLKTVSSTDAYLNLDDCILHYSPMCYLNFVLTARIVRLTLHFILCNRFHVLLLHSICNRVRMTCLIKRLLILSYLMSGQRMMRVML